MSNRKPITCCSYYGGTEGIFTKTTLIGWPRRKDGRSGIEIDGRTD